MNTPDNTSKTTSVPVEKSDAQWREELTPEEYRVLRQAGTERPYTGEYWDTHTEGEYQCRACGSRLFTSREKFDSHCGWPSFWAPWPKVRSGISMTAPWEWIVLKSGAPTVTLIWGGTFSRARAMARPRTSGSALIPCRFAW